MLLFFYIAKRIRPKQYGVHMLANIRTSIVQSGVALLLAEREPMHAYIVVSNDS